METDEIKVRVAGVAARYRERLTAVYLFGSRAEGRATSLSDLDIAVLLNPRERPSFFDLRFSLYADFSRALKINNIDLTLLNTLDNLMILEEILRRGVLLYDANPDLREEFEIRILHRVMDFKEQRRLVMGI